MRCHVPLFLALASLSGLFCQCQSAAPEFVRNPNLPSYQVASDDIAVFAQAPGAYRELGPVSAKPSLGKSWKRAIASMKKQAAAMGADAIIVPQLASYDRAAMSEAYLGEEGAFTPGSSQSQLKMGRRIHGLAIQLPTP